VALALCACGGDGDTAANAEPVASGEEGAARNVAAAKSDDAMEAPSWELPDLEGRLIDSKSYAGKTLVMDFWATWCRKCGAPGFPALAVVRPDGRIDSMHVGLIEEAELEAAIAKSRGL